MSLFKSREWWSTQCGTNEEFDHTSLLVSKLNSDFDYVIVGSHNGFLRIYQPSAEKQEDGQLLDYKPTDLIIETQLPYPILQLCTGRLVSGSQIIQLAILHPRSVGIYSLVTKSGVAEHGTQNSVLLVYEHALKRSTSNMVIGPFGGSQNRDFICVQSLDGMLTFFEQEIFSFCCFLPEFLLPNPIVFIKTTDSFITCGSNWNIESFSYKKLSENSQNSNINDTDGVRFESDWSFNIGENVLDIVVVDSAMNETCVVVLGERNMFCLADCGKLKFMKKFDFSPHCFHPYYIRTSTKLMIIVVTETNTMLLYENATLRWSAQLSFLPVAVARGFFACVSGTMVLLSDQGALQFCYLGTEPQLFTAPPLQNQELDFEKAEEELNTLNKIIRTSKANDIALTNATVERDLIVTVSVNPHLETCTFEHDVSFESEETLSMCMVSVELLPNSPFEEVQISLIVNQPLVVQPNIHFVNNLDDKAIFDSYVYMNKYLDVVSLELKVVVSHITNVGIPRILIRSAQLPLKLVMSSAPPVKESVHKVTLNINEQAPQLSVLFPEYMGENSLSLSSNAVGFKSVTGSGSPVTILLAKSSQRYRLQSDSIANLNLFSDQIIIRLTKHFEKKTEFKITQSASLPTVQFLEVIERHFEKRNIVTNLQNDISELAAQFRLIQKRLIAKFKDKNPTPLHNLDTLMYETYSEIITCSEKLLFEREELLKVQCELSCVIRLMILLLKHSELPEDILKKVSSVFVTPIHDLEEQGWEDSTDVCISHLLRTVLAKSEKDRLKNTGNTFDQVKDISKFKKRISQVIDRLTKGGALLETQSKDENEDNEKSVDIPEITETVPQVGSKIAASSVRAQSARLARTKLLSTPEEVEGEEV